MRMTSLYLWKEITDTKMPDEEKRMTKRLVYGHSCFTVDLVCFLIIKITSCRDIKFVSWIFVLSLFRRKLDSIITKLYHATPLGRGNLEETNTVKCLLCCHPLRERSHLPFAHAHVLIEVNLRQSDGLMTGAICIQIQELPSCNPKVALTFVTVSLRYIFVQWRKFVRIKYSMFGSRICRSMFWESGQLAPWRISPGLLAPEENQ